MVFGNAAASAPRDFGKKNRANRSAKLKQCKLDARREQWLSQGAVAKNKEGKEEAVVLPPPPPANDCQKGRNDHPLETTRRKGKRGKDGIGEEEHHDNCSYSDSSFSSPTGSSILGGTNYGGSSSSSSSSSSVSGCCSGSITEEEEEEEGGGVEDDCLDDWEAVADALAADDDNQKQGNQDSHHGLEVELGSPREHGKNVVNLSSTHESLKQECGKTLPPRLAPRNSRAWRPDDVFRPQSLPTLSNQLSFNAHVGANPWFRCASSVPSSCPICCEEFDCTDTSFLPCLCGFRLCLFCHNRILQEDGRCPGCRKHYEHKQVEAQANGHGGGLTLRLDRSSSMN